jgi:hypothetical protein
MTEESSIEDLFENLLTDKTEKEIMKQIIDNKEPEDIISNLLNSQGSK